ncbi:transposase [Raphidiopsis curvata NIES-932]|nr:transposase [Raphidiopsis curvata NIES-932]BAZ89750.1 transposase [Raphidiopsis curvata NIES-932]
MLDLDRILNQERLLRAMTGLNRQAFNELLSQFADTYERTVFNSLANRKRAPGGGRKPTLRTGETILYLTVLQMLSDV